MVAHRLCAGSSENGAGVTLVRCRDSSISDCQILDPLHRGIELEDCTRCRATNNTIVDRREKKSMRHAIRATGGGHNLIAGNLVGGATEKGVDATDGTAVVRDNLDTGL